MRVTHGARMIRKALECRIRYIGLPSSPAPWLRRTRKLKPHALPSTRIATALTFVLAAGTFSAAFANVVIVRPVAPTQNVQVVPNGKPKIIFVPKSVTFNKGEKSPKSMTANFPKGQADQFTQLKSTSCGSGSSAIASIDTSFAEYGIYSVTPGTVNGSCSFTVTDKVNKVKGKGKVINNSN
jgi:hypothetical protein